MKNIYRQLSVLAVFLIAASPVWATNGYFAHGYGTKNKGLVGAGVALPQDAMIAATNPAGMVFVGDRIDLGAALFSPSPRSYEPTALTAPPTVPPEFPLAPGNEESGSDYFIIPHFAKNWVYDPNSTMGLTVYGNGGMNTDYSGSAPCLNPSTPGTFCAGGAGVDLAQLFINGTYSRKINATSSFGVSLILAYQRFEAKGLSSFAGYSTDPANVSNNGVDTSTGYGIKLGWQGEVSPGLTLAASYQSEMDMSEFDDYAGLFAEEGDFDIPATWTVGLAYQVNSTSKLVFDVQKMMYSKVASVGNPVSYLVGPSNSCATGNVNRCLGGSDGAGFGWEDMTVYKIAYQWTVPSMAGYTWRAGYSRGDQPIPDEEVMFNILAPAVIEQHVTFGFTKDMGAGKEFNFAFMYALENDITGSNPTVASSNQEITLEMRQWEIEGSYSW